MKMRSNESPAPVPEGMLQAGFEAKIMHVSFAIGAMTLMESDGCDDKSKFDGFRLALSLPSSEACEKCFHALAGGGKIVMPLTKTCRKRYYENGQLWDEGEYQLGQKVGEWKTYDKSGAIKQQKTFKPK